MSLGKIQPLYNVNVTIVNNYGYDVDVRSSTDRIKGFDILTGAQRRFTFSTASAEAFVLRFYDSRDGIPILYNGESYVKIIPSLLQDGYIIVLEPGIFQFSK